MIPVTVVMVTSPIPAHPDTDVIDATLASIRERLPDAEVLIGCDGVAPAVQHRTDDYHEYLRRLCWNAARTTKVTPYIFDRHVHQVGMVRELLPLVRTPLVLWSEHDTPLVGEVDWEGCAKAIDAGAVDVIRYYHEAVLQPEHAAMTVPAPVDGPVPLLATMQWSQRPHLASTEAYRRLMAGPWWEPTDGMLEDRLHSVVQSAPWDEFKVALYYPDGSLQRSTHLDGRGADPKVTTL